MAAVRTKHLVVRLTGDGPSLADPPPVGAAVPLEVTGAVFARTRPTTHKPPISEPLGRGSQGLGVASIEQPARYLLVRAKFEEAPSCATAESRRVRQAGPSHAESSLTRLAGR